MPTLDDELKKAANGGDRDTPTNAAVAVRSNDAPKGNLKLLVGLLVAGGVMLALVFNFRDAAVYAKSVHQVLAEGAKPGRMVRVEGDLVNGTLKQETEPSCLYKFTITDGTERLDVRYANCVVPDTFRDVPGTKVTVEGEMATAGTMKATQIMAKCPSKYEMKDRATKGEAVPHGAMPSGS
jgi:cytochrome c-type biogenesis protein CcmE